MDSSQASTIGAANAALIVHARLDAAVEFFTPGYVVHLTDGDLGRGPAAVRRFVEMLHDGFSDLEVEVEMLLESGDRVAWQRTVRGMQTGSFRGFPPSNRLIVWRDMLTSRFENGRIAEEWAVSDLAERLLQARKG